MEGPLRSSKQRSGRGNQLEVSMLQHKRYRLRHREIEVTPGFGVGKTWNNSRFFRGSSVEAHVSLSPHLPKERPIGRSSKCCADIRARCSVYGYVECAFTTDAGERAWQTVRNIDASASTSRSAHWGMPSTPAFHVGHIKMFGGGSESSQLPRKYSFHRYCRSVRTTFLT